MPRDQTTTVEPRRRLDATAGSSWGFQDGMVRLQLWPERCADPFSIWMTPGQVLDLIESGARAARKAMKEQL